MNIIASLFRDTGQPDTGLTPAVEEIAASVMRRMARVGADPKAPNGATALTNVPQVATPRQMAILMMLAKSAHATTELAAAENVTTENIYRTCHRLESRGCVEAQETRRGLARWWKITPTGRAALESTILPAVGTAKHKDAAE